MSFFRYKSDPLKTILDNCYRLLPNLILIVDNQSKSRPFYIIAVYLEALRFCFRSVGYLLSNSMLLSLVFSISERCTQGGDANVYNIGSSVKIYVSPGEKI